MALFGPVGLKIDLISRLSISEQGNNTHLCPCSPDTELFSRKTRVKALHLSASRKNLH